MKKVTTKVLTLLLAVLVILMQLPQSYVMAAQSNEIVEVNKSINPSEILEGEQTEVSVNVKGSRPVNVVKPNDIVLIIDRSGSMRPSGNENKMGNAKSAAKGFIDLIDFSKHRVAIVDYSTDVKYHDFSTNPTELKDYVNKLEASGSTATGFAIDKARELLANHRSESQPVIVLMTDGKAEEQGISEEKAREKALTAATNAKNERIVFYTIALLLSGENPNTSAPNLLMKEMATTSKHHHFVLGSVGLADIYAAIVKEIGLASAYDVVVEDTVAPEFEIVPDSYKDNIPQPTVVGNKLTWKFNELKDELLTFKYKIQHKKGSKVGDLSTGEKEIYVKYNDYLGNPHEFNLAHPVIKVSYPAPTITSVVEDNGKVQGGESVVINGQGFRPNPVVKFGDNVATKVEFVSSTKLIVEAPVGTQGKTQITVTNDDGQFATSDYRYYAIPEISKIAPNEGPLAGNNEVVIEGAYFLSGAHVKFGSAEAKVVSLTSDKIVVTAPSASALGSVAVEVVNPDGTKVNVPDGYTYISGPEFLSITPDKGLTTGGESIVISGKNFKPDAKVYFDQMEVTAIVDSSTNISLITPAWTKAGSVTVKVVNPDGQFVELPQAYTYIYPKPEIATIEPNNGPVSGGGVANVTGSGFISGAKVYFNDTLLRSTVYNSSSIKIEIPRWNTGEAVTVKIVNPDEQVAVLQDGYSYNLPDQFEVTEIMPNTGPLDGGTTVQISGKNFINGTKVYFDDKELKLSSLNAELISLKTPSWESATKVTIKVVDPYGREIILNDAFEYLAPPPPPAPEIMSITPDEGELTGGLMVSIAGNNFDKGLKVYFNDTPITATRYSATEIKAYTPKWSVEGPVNIKVVNPDGQEAILSNGFTYLAPPPPPSPEITSISPEEGELSGGLIVTINGANFANGVKVYFNDTSVTATKFSSTLVKVSTPSWTLPGKVDVKIVNPDGQESTLKDGFEYLAPPSPVITSATPNNGMIDGGTTVTVNGENFIRGAKVTLKTTEVATTFVSAKQLKFTTPKWPAAEVVDITVTNPDGQSVSLSNAFTFETPPPPPAPELKEVSPSEGELKGGLVITLTGNNFESGVKVYFNDTVVTATRYSKTQIKVSTPKWDVPGAVDIKVINPDNQEAMLPNGFTYLAPPTPPPSGLELTGVTPNEGQLSGGTIITLTGRDFQSGVKVYINDVQLTATRYGATQIKASTPKWTTPGAVNVKVVNPDGNESTLIGGFTYLAPPGPKISVVSPGSGLVSGGTTVSIAGENFVKGATVKLNNTEVAATFVSAKQLKFVTPVWALPEIIDITVTNPDGQQGTLPQAFTFEAPPPLPAPEITSVSPNEGKLSGGMIVTILGNNLLPGVKVFFNDTELTATRWSNSKILAYSAKWAVEGPVNVKVVNTDGQEFVLTGGFTYK